MFTPFKIDPLLQQKIRRNMNVEGKLEACVKKYEFNQSKTIKENIDFLVDVVAQGMEINDQKAKSMLKEYLYEDKNIPIEVNFKLLKAEHLQHILLQWLQINSEHSSSSQPLSKFYTPNHKNLLIKRVLFDQKSTIDAYYETLSGQKDRLKGVDLYQLMVDIMGNYYLYEYDDDGETFFEKINSFDTFLGIVDRFVNWQKRIILDHTEQNIDYIRRYEFEKLLEFWEQQNPELTLLSSVRKNHQEISTQTSLLTMNEASTQTIQQQESLLSIIQQTMLDLNRLTISLQNSEELECLDRIYEGLRKEKINIIGRDKSRPTVNAQFKESQDEKSQKTERMDLRTSKNNVMENSFLSQYNPSPNHNQVHKKPRRQSDIFAPVSPKFHENQVLPSQRKMSPFERYSSSPTRRRKKLIGAIFSYYSMNGSLSILQLHEFLVDLGVIDNNEHWLVAKIIAEGKIKDGTNVTIEQISDIMGTLMKEDKELTIEVLEQFVKITCETPQIKIFRPPSPKKETVHSKPHISMSYHNLLAKEGLKDKKEVNLQYSNRRGRF